MTQNNINIQTNNYVDNRGRNIHDVMKSHRNPLNWPNHQLLADYAQIEKPNIMSILHKYFSNPEKLVELKSLGRAEIKKTKENKKPIVLDL